MWWNLILLRKDLGPHCRWADQIVEYGSSCIIRFTSLHYARTLLVDTFENMRPGW